MICTLTNVVTSQVKEEFCFVEMMFSKRYCKFLKSYSGQEYFLNNSLPSSIPSPFKNGCAIFGLLDYTFKVFGSILDC